MRCPSCKGQDVGHIRFSALGPGIEFHYCRPCEHRWWTSGSRMLELGTVLDRATVLPRAS